MQHYRTLFTGVLVQDSALSVGGNDPTSTVDSPLCRDGLGRPTLRGTTLAGALIATARKIFGDVAPHICLPLGSDPEAANTWESAWRFFNAHPVAEDASRLPEYRQGVGIRHDTAAAKTGVLFDLETLPRGTAWQFCLEVDSTIDAEPRADAVAAAGLLEWTRGRCWIGRNVARGLGWLILKDLEARVLTLDHLDCWPDSSDEPIEIIRKLPVPPIPSNAFTDWFAWNRSPEPWSYLEIEGTLRAGERSDGYGLDALSVGGHPGTLALAEWDDHYLGPQGQSEQAKKKSFEPDFPIVLTLDIQGKPEPIIPGSGLRGTLRHAVSHMLRAGGTSVRDPNVDKEIGNHPDNVDDLFGTMKKSAALLVRDAYLTPGSSWKAAWFQNHAEDEFSAGAFGTGKFDRVALVQGLLKWKMVIEAPTVADCTGHGDMVRSALSTLGAYGHLPVGGGQWRGVGWPEWKVTSVKLCAAGSDHYLDKTDEWTGGRG